MPAVQVLHIEKRMTIAGGLNRHITRVQWVDGELVVWVPCNADPERTKDNIELVSREFTDLQGVKRTLSLQEAVNKRINEAGIKPRKTQSRCLEMIFSGSPEVLCKMSREEVLKWAKDTLEWAQKTWGKENVVSASLHLDEKTPHIHMIVVPIVQGQSRRTKKQKQTDKEKGVVRESYKIDHNKPRLCVNEVFTTPLLYYYHDHYALEVSNKYGLERGLRAEPGNKKRHQDSEDYNRQLAAETREKKAVLAEIKEDYKTTTEKVEDAKEQLKVVEERKIIAEQQAAEKESRVKELEEKTSSLSGEINAKEERLSSQKATITKNRTIIDNQVADFNARKEELTQIKADISENSEKIKTQRQAISQNDSIIIAQEKQIKASSVIREDAIDKIIAEKMISVAVLTQEETRLSRSITDKKTALSRESANLQRTREQIGTKVHLDNIPKEGAFGFKSSEVRAFIESVELASLRRAMNNVPRDIDVNQELRSEVDRLRSIEDEYKALLQSREQLQQRIEYLKTKEKRTAISEILKYALQKDVNVIYFTIDDTGKGEDIFVKFTKAGDSRQFAGRITPEERISYTEQPLNSLQDVKANWGEKIWWVLGSLTEIQQKREREDILSRYSAKLTKLANKKLSVTDFEKGEDGRILLFSDNGRVYEVGADGKTWSTADSRVKTLADCGKFSNEKIWTNEGDINNPTIKQGKGLSM